MVIQLVRRIPGAEPDRDVVKAQVAAFRLSAVSLISESQFDEEPDEEDGASVAKLFEEVKVMFQDLPSRIERRFDPDYPSKFKRKRHLGGKAVYEIVYGAARDAPEGIGLLIASSLFRDDFPWIYDLSVEAFRYLAAGDQRALRTLKQLDELFHLTTGHPLTREANLRSRDRMIEIEMMADSIRQAISYARDRAAQVSGTDEPITSRWTEGRLEILQQRWDEGQTALQIAEELGVSRSAVIGKAHRLGLNLRPAPSTTPSDETDE